MPRSLALQILFSAAALSLACPALSSASVSCTVEGRDYCDGWSNGASCTQQGMSFCQEWSNGIHCVVGTTG